MTTYGPFTPAGWTSADLVACSGTSFDAVPVSANGGYVDDGDPSVYMFSARFAVNTTGMASFTSATLVLTRDPSSYGSSGANGVLSLRLEDTTSSAAFSSGDRPYNRTHRTVEVEYDFPNSTGQVSIDVSSIFADFYATYGAGNHVITVSIGAQQLGWTASSVSWRDVCCTSSGALPSLTIEGGAAGAGAVLPWVYA